MAFTQKLTPEQALQKARHFCAYQERCHDEVKQKLYSFGLYRNEVDTALSTLIEENYLNEERFAIQFAGGRFRMKQWGRVKIKHELQQKKVSDYCIRKGLKEIDEEDYIATLEKLAQKKWESLNDPGSNMFVKMSKTTDYLLQKGFEFALVKEVVQQCKSTP